MKRNEIYRLVSLSTAHDAPFLSLALLTKSESGHLQFCFREQNVALHLRVVLDKGKLPRQRPRVFPLDVERPGPGGGEELDEERGTLFGSGHFSFFFRGFEVLRFFAKSFRSLCGVVSLWERDGREKRE